MGALTGRRLILLRDFLQFGTKTELEYAVDLKTVVDIYHIKRTDIEGCIISSVVPQITNAVKLAAEKVLHKEPMVLGHWSEDRSEYYDG